MLRKLKIALAICLPLLLAGFGSLVIVNTRSIQPLYGDMTYRDTLPTFTKDVWISGTYQKNVSAYLDDNFGFRNYFIRTRNQVYYSAFSEIKTQAIVVGKENCLFEENYITEYYGQNFLGQDSLMKLVAKTKDVDSLLNAINKKLILVFAPGKASFSSAYIPDECQHNFSPENTNYAVLASALTQSDISFIDARRWFLKMKDTSSHLLYGKTGIHWTKYGQHLFIDSLNTLMRDAGAMVPKMTITSLEKGKARIPDNDLEAGLNIFSSITNETFAYPKVSFGQPKLKEPILLLGDSYLWDLYNEHYFDHLYDNYAYYYFNQEAYLPKYQKVPVDPVQQLNDLQRAKYFVLVMTEANYKRYYFNYINDLYTLLTSENSVADYQKEIERIKGDILLDAEWTELIKKQAKEQNCSFEEALEKNAVYMYNLNKQ